MAKRTPRLQFTEEEWQNPELAKPIKKAEKAADKLEKAEANIPKKTVKTKERTIDPNTGKTVVRLHFEKTERNRRPSCNMPSVMYRLPQLPPGSIVKCGMPMIMPELPLPKHPFPPPKLFIMQAKQYSIPIK